MGSFVGSPGAPHKILVIGVMHSSPSFATSTQTTEIHFITSLLTVPNGQRPNGSRLALHPCMGHIWSLGSMHNHSNKLGRGGQPYRSCSPLSHNTKTSHRSQRQSAALPAPRLTSLQAGTEGQFPQLILLPGKGANADSQQRLLQINPLSNLLLMPFTPSE